MKKIIIQFTLILVFLTVNSFACTVFTASDKNRVLVGNNEDNSPNLKSYLWFYPEVNGKNGYVTWGNFKKFPEGGMNQKGLFWDAAAMPNKIPIVLDSKKENFKDYFLEKALSECATVDEVLILISKFNLLSQEKAQILIADATGNYAIIHANYVIKKSDLKQNHFSVANFCLNDSQSANYQCHRRGFSQKALASNKEINEALFKKILEKTSQTDINNITLYSQICNLKTQTFELFQRYDFTVSSEINLTEELAKGIHTIEMKTLFPEPISSKLEGFFKNKEYIKANEAFDSIRKNDAQKTNFNFRYLDDLGFKYLNEGNIETAFEIFKLNLKANPKSDNANASLALAYLKKNEFQMAKTYFRKTQKLNNSNYLAHIFKKNKKGFIVFEIHHFEEVEKLALVGSFNQYDKNKNLFEKQKDGSWICKIKLNKGQYAYKLVVGDNNWYNDPFNKLLIKPEKYWDNLLIIE